MPGTAKIKRFFQSAELTGTGSAQNVAHLLGYVPRSVIITVSEDTGLAGTLDVLEGTHTATNVILTAPATIKFRVTAW